MTREAAVLSWTDGVSDALGDAGLDLLINNAGILTPGPIEVLPLDAIRREFDSKATWTIPKQRMKGRNPQVVYLSRQALGIFVALHICVAGSRFVLPSGYDTDRCMSNATLDRVTQIVAERAKAAGLPQEPFTVHDLRRTGSMLLNEVGFNRDWIEKCLAHEDGRSSRSIYNKAEYAEQRRHMLQEWADMVDAWIDGRTHVPKLFPENAVVPVLSAAL
jgi:hypothetical protein